MRTVAGEETVFNRVQKDIVYFRPEGETIRLGEMREVLLPETVGILQFQYNRDKFRLQNRSGGVVSKE